MRFKPMPFYDKGFVVPRGDANVGAGIGRMFGQPNVRVDNGVTMKLDDALGDWITILGWQADPTASLAPGQLEELLRMGVTFYKVVGACPSAQRRVVSFDETLVLEDIDNDLRQWFEGNGMDYVLLRPDRYVAAAATEHDLGEQVQRLLSIARGAADPISTRPRRQSA
jgi:3-(3-hydroxy-phenyl)propionate hydroxylase